MSALEPKEDSPCVSSVSSYSPRLPWPRVRRPPSHRRAALPAGGLGMEADSRTLSASCGIILPLRICWGVVRHNKSCPSVRGSKHPLSTIRPAPQKRTGDLPIASSSKHNLVAGRNRRLNQPLQRLTRGELDINVGRRASIRPSLGPTVIRRSKLAAKALRVARRATER